MEDTGPLSFATLDAPNGVGLHVTAFTEYRGRVDDPQALVGRALAGQPEAVHALTVGLCPALQAQINAGLLARGLVDRTDRRVVLDLMRTLLGTLFMEQGALLRSWDPKIPLEAWVAHLGATHSAHVLNQTVDLPPEREPRPEQVQVWWLAATSGQAQGLASSPAQQAHALMVLRPLMEHESHALAAELLPRGHGAIPSPASSPAARKTRKTLDKRQKRGLGIAAGLAVVAVLGATADRVLSDPYEDLVPTFVLKARPGEGKARAQYRLGDPIEVTLHPTQGIEWSAQRPTGEPILLGVDALARHTSGRVFNWAYSMTHTERGDFILRGVVGKTLPLTPGDWDVFFVLGPREELEILDTGVAIGDKDPPPPFERLRYPIRVLGESTGTATVAP